MQGTWKTVTGTYIIPTPIGYGMSTAWVGIDGDSCPAALLQTGIDLGINGDGDYVYKGMYPF